MVLADERQKEVYNIYQISRAQFFFIFLMSARLRAKMKRKEELVIFDAEARTAW